MKLRPSVTVSLVVLVPMLVASPASGLDFFEFIPGSPRPEVEGRLREAGLRFRSPEPSRIEVRATLLPGVFELQRAVFDFGVDGRLHTATVEITPAFNSDGLDVLELYEEVASTLLRRLGNPARERSTGTIRDAGQILVGLSNGEVERMMEWEADHTVRAGIPRRVDGKVLVLVMVSSRELSENNPFWGPDHL
jgi:hypothetical protein